MLPSKVAEYELASELLKRDMTPLWPSSDEGYDMVVSRYGRAVRIQVKGTESEGPPIKVTVKSERGAYTEEDCDIIVIRVFSADLWYIIPVDQINVTSIRINPKKKSCRWRKFQNAWRHIVEPTK